MVQRATAVDPTRAPETAVGARVHAVVVATLVACLLGVLALTAVALSQQHERLLDLMAAERSSQLEDAAERVADDFDDVTGNLEFALQLVEGSPDEDSAWRSLSALLGAVPRYRSAAVAGRDCALRRIVRDPRGSWSESAALDAALAETAGRACRGEGPVVLVSRPLDDPDLKWFRVFARSARSGGGRGAGPVDVSVVALVVDTAPVLDRLKSLTADVDSELLVLGPHGSPAPVSHPRASRGLAGGTSPTLTALAERMRLGEQGVVVVPSAEAVALGYPDADLLAVFHPIPVADAAPGWSAAVLVPADRMQAHERAIALALLGSGAAGTAVLALLAAYVVRVGRAEAAAQERLQTAEQLAHLRERAERILDHVPAGVVALGRDGGVTSANITFERWAGRSPVGLPMAALFATEPETAARLGRVVADTSASGRVQGLSPERLSLFGREVTCAVHAVPIHPATDEVSTLLVLDDVTELRALQDQLLRTEKLATVGVLAAGIAHEVGTPLGVIRGRAELVARKLGSDHAQGRSLQAILEQIDAISRTIRALMDFATPRPAAAGALDPTVVVSRVGELLHYEADKRRVELVASIAADVPFVRADADQVQQVLVNLVMNAFDASPQGAAVRIDVREVTGPTPGRWVSLAVHDAGSGIPAEHLHRIFDPFFTTKKRGQGTGLGLAIVNQITRDHGGVVRVDSQPGRGTTVEVLLPAIPGGDRV